MTVIAITRELATLGSEVSSGLAERLGLDIVHHELVEHDIAERTGLHETDVHRYLEGETSLLERWTRDMKRLSRHTAREILELAGRNNVLIRGLGATYLLRHVPHVICVRICAPMAFREQVLMSRQGLEDAATARREIERSDAMLNGAMQRLFGTNRDDPTLYEIVLNTARVPVADCVDQIARLAQSRLLQETAQSRSALMNELILARVHDAMERRFGQNPLHSGLEAHVSDGMVVLTGATTDEQLIVEAIRLVQRVEGVRSVESRVEHIAFTPHAR